MSIQTQLTQIFDEGTKTKLRLAAKELDMFNAAFELWVDNTIACDLYSVMFHPDGRITGVRSNMNGHYMDEPNAKQYLLDCYTKHTNAKISAKEQL